MGRPASARRREYMQRYGATKRQVQIVGVDVLDRMTEDGRAVYFSTLRWDKAHPYWKVDHKYPRSKRGDGLYCEMPAEDKNQVQKMMALTAKLRRAA